jgi:hypothetical protein
MHCHPGQTLTAPPLLLLLQLLQVLLCCALQCLLLLLLVLRPVRGPWVSSVARALLWLSAGWPCRWPGWHAALHSAHTASWAAAHQQEQPPLLPQLLLLMVHCLLCLQLHLS